MIPLRAMAHPLRLRILSLLTGATLSATEVAAELGVAHAVASYHLRELASAGLIQTIEPDETANRPAGRPRVRYKHVADYHDRLDRSQGREVLFAAMLDDLSRQFREMKHQHRVDHAEVWLERETWEQACELSDRLSELVHSRAVPPRTDGAIHSSVTVSVFEL